MNSTTNIKKSHCNIIGRDNVTITLTLKNNNNNNKENTVNVTVITLWQEQVSRVVVASNCC